MTPVPQRPAPLRILHSVGHLSRGGIETWLYETIRRLDFPRYEHHVIVWTQAEEAYTAEFRDAGVQVHALPGHPKPLRFANEFRQLVRAYGPFDVLHTHGTQFQGYVMALGRTLGIRKRIAHSHTDIRPVLNQSSRWYRAYATLGHRGIRAFATAGRAVSELAAISMFGPRWRNDPRWQVLHCGIDLDRFARPPEPALRASLGIPPGRTVLGHVGRFEPQKNQAFLLEVAEALLRNGADPHLLLVGDGSLRVGIQNAAAQRGLASRVTMLPDCRDVAGVMAGAMDVMVLPSLYEGLPLVLVEAQAAGLPCLASDACAPEATVHAPLVRRLPLAAGPMVWAQAVPALPPRIDPRDRGLRRALEASTFSLAHSVARLGELYETSAGSA